MTNDLTTTADADMIDIIDIDRSVKNIPIESIIDFANREPPLSYQDIADLVGCSKQNVYDRLQRVGYSRDCAKHYEKNRVKVFQFLQAKLINSIDEESIQKASALQRVVAAGILYDKERLESGKSSQNISIVEITGSIAELQDQADKLRQSL